MTSTHCRQLKVIIDTDPGIDDAIALLLALAAPGLEIRGLTTVGGNVSLEYATRNALALLEYAGRADLPVAQGSAGPLSGQFPYAHYFHGATGLSVQLPDPQNKPVIPDAVEFLRQQIEECPSEITLVALGPLTNLARLTQQYPEALHNLSSLIIMGGAVNCPGNITPCAEFNFYSDPEAAQVVLSTKVAPTLIDLAATCQVCVEHREVARWRADTNLGQLAIKLLESWFQEESRRERLMFHDPLAIAAAIRPEMLTTRPAQLWVDTSDSQWRGATITKDYGNAVTVAERVDSDSFFRLMGNLLGLRYYNN